MSEKRRSAVLGNGGWQFPPRDTDSVTRETGAAEVVFNTSMTGYQEICTDASYRGTDGGDDLSH